MSSSVTRWATVITLVLATLCLYVTSYPAYNFPRSSILEYKRAGLRMMCLVHPRNCPSRLHKRVQETQGEEPSKKDAIDMSKLWLEYQMNIGNKNHKNIENTGASWPSDLSSGEWNRANESQEEEDPANKQYTLQQMKDALYNLFER